eukprot:135222_1
MSYHTIVPQIKHLLKSNTLNNNKKSIPSSANNHDITSPQELFVQIPPTKVHNNDYTLIPELLSFDHCETNILNIINSLLPIQQTASAYSMWIALRQLYKIKKQKIENINEHNNKSILYKLSDDMFCLIIEYLSISDYVFNILLITNKIHQQFGPYERPFIINKLIANQCKKYIFGVPFLENIDWFTGFRDSENTWMAKHMNKYNSKPIDSLDSWRICGTYSWTNYERELISETENNKYLSMLKNPKHQKRLSFLSSLYLLNFMYIARFGGISQTPKLKQLLLQSISSGKGGLGIRYMFYYYFKQFFIDPINNVTDININIHTGEITSISTPTTSNRIVIPIKIYLYKLYELSYQDTLFEFVEMFRRIICVDAFYDLEKTTSNESTRDPVCGIQMVIENDNIRVNLFYRLYKTYNAELIKAASFLGHDLALKAKQSSVQTITNIKEKKVLKVKN